VLAVIDLAPIEAVLTRALVAAVERHHELTRAVRRESGLLTRQGLATRLAVSVAHIGRLESEGLPALVVGDTSSKRFDLDEVRAWLKARTPRATTPTKKDNVDVSDALTAAGMKTASGAQGVHLGAPMLAGARVSPKETA